MNTDGLTSDQVAQLQAQADQMREENELAKKWPRDGDDMYRLTQDGRVSLMHYSQCFSREVAQGNIFRARPEAEAEGRYREMRQKAREAFVVPNLDGLFLIVDRGDIRSLQWQGGAGYWGAANLGLAFNNDDEGRALAQEALAVYQGSIFKEWPR